MDRYINTVYYYIEEKINMLVEGRKMLINASYFAFIATPKKRLRCSATSSRSPTDRCGIIRYITTPC